MANTNQVLNPKAREDRAMRSNLVRELKARHDRFLGMYGPSAKVTVQCAVAHDFLNHVRRSPWRTGYRKNELFKQVARELAADRG